MNSSASYFARLGRGVTPPLRLRAWDLPRLPARRVLLVVRGSSDRRVELPAQIRSAPGRPYVELDRALARLLRSIVSDGVTGGRDGRNH